MTRNALVTIAALLALPSLAHAHAFLQSAQPPVGSTVRTAPSEVEITYTEAVEPKLCRITVTGPAGKAVSSGEPHIDRDAKHLAIAVDAHQPGPYHVVWHATAVDTHQTDGSFDFTVAP